MMMLTSNGLLKLSLKFYKVDGSKVFNQDYQENVAGNSFHWGQSKFLVGTPLKFRGGGNIFRKKIKFSHSLAIQSISQLGD